MTLKWLKVPGWHADGRTLLRARSDIQRGDGTHCCYEIVVDARGAASLSGDLVDEISLYEHAAGAKEQAQKLEDENTVVARGPDPDTPETITLCSCSIEQRGDKFVATLNTSAWSRYARQDSLQGAASWLAYWLGFVATRTTPPPASGEAAPTQATTAAL